MAALTPLVAPTNLLQAQSTPASTAELAKRADIKQTAQDFEASFLSIMLQQMFKDVQVSKPFGGGQGEEMFQSFMTDAFAQQMSKAGGIGLADTVAREMLKLQGLE